MLIYYFNGDQEWVDDLTEDEPYFQQICKIKIQQTPENLCTGKAAPLLPFFKEVFSIEFDEKPHYGKLR
jgi:hypothetical protein